MPAPDTQLVMLDALLLARRIQQTKRAAIVITTEEIAREKDTRGVALLLRMKLEAVADGNSTVAR